MGSKDGESGFRLPPGGLLPRQGEEEANTTQVGFLPTHLKSEANTNALSAIMHLL